MKTNATAKMTASTAKEHSCGLELSNIWALVLVSTTPYKLSNSKSEKSMKYLANRTVHQSLKAIRLKMTGIRRPPSSWPPSINQSGQSQKQSRMHQDQVGMPQLPRWTRPRPEWIRDSITERQSNKQMEDSISRSYHNEVVEDHHQHKKDIKH